MISTKLLLNINSWYDKTRSLIVVTLSDIWWQYVVTPGENTWWHTLGRQRRFPCKHCQIKPTKNLIKIYECCHLSIFPNNKAIGKNKRKSRGFDVQRDLLLTRLIRYQNQKQAASVQFRSGSGSAWFVYRVYLQCITLNNTRHWPITYLGETHKHNMYL